MASTGQSIANPGGRKPEWLKRTVAEPRHVARMERVLRARNLHTVCESALCPNLGTCFGRGTATFLIMGDVCTRACRFCGVGTGAPADLDPLEAYHVADAAASLGLQHVVITSVTRDDLADGGASHYVATIQAVRERLLRATVEVLVPDFQGREESVELVLSEAPEVFNHNVETVPRLYGSIRPQAEYERSLAVLRRAALAGRSAVKTGCMVGLGETQAEVEELLQEVAQAGVTMVTIGQYLRPTRESAPVVEYVEPRVFDQYRECGEALGLLVSAGPFVRSSYQAGEAFAEVRERSGK